MNSKPNTKQVTSAKPSTGQPKAAVHPVSKRPVMMPQEHQKLSAEISKELVANLNRHVK